MVERVEVPTVGAWCAISTVPVLIGGGALLSTSGAGDLIPQTGSAGQKWLLAVASAPGAFAAGGWLLILMGYLVLVAFVGLYFTLREAGSIVVLAPVLGVAAMVLVTVSHLIPIGMAYELAPAFAAAPATNQGALSVVADVLAATSLVINAAGNALGWGVVVPIYAWAILKTRALPRWIGWLGLVVAVLAGWLGLVAPLSSVVNSISSFGFPAFFLFLLCSGIATLRRQTAHRRHVAGSGG
jgi:hypothetical protein